MIRFSAKRVLRVLLALFVFGVISLLVVTLIIALLSDRPKILHIP
jgi:hypothetical protein